MEISRINKQNIVDTSIKIESKKTEKPELQENKDFVSFGALHAGSKDFSIDLSGMKATGKMASPSEQIVRQKEDRKLSAGSSNITTLSEFEGDGIYGTGKVLETGADDQYFLKEFASSETTGATESSVNLSGMKATGKMSSPSEQIVRQKEDRKPSAGSGNITTLSMFEGEGIYGSTATGETGVSDQYLLYDNFDSSRDIVSVTAEEGKPSEPYRFTLKFNDLQPGADLGNLDAYLMLSIGQGGKVNLPDGIPGITEQPWNVAIGAYDNQNFSVYDENGVIDGKSVIKDIKFDYMKDTVELSLDKDIFRKKGWEDGGPLTIQTFAAKDFVKKVIDSLDDPDSKPWVNDGKLTAFLDTKARTTSSPVTSPAVSSSGTSTSEKIDWRNESIYFVLTDRFHDGDKTNNMDVNKESLHRYHGGDLQGLIDKLDYVKDLGLTTIWLTPVMDNQTSFVNSDGYHGYWPIDFYNVDEHLGDMDKFKEFVDKAHEKDLKVILDIPLNHTAWEHPFWKDPEKHDWFHHEGDVQNWNDPYEAEHGSIFGLPDLAQENPVVEKYLIDTAKFWIDKGIDGFRLDAVKNIHKPFFDKFDRAIHEYAGDDFFLVGECFDGDPNKVNSYQQKDMDSLFDYPLYFTTKQVFAHDGSMRGLAGQIANCNNTYKDPDRMSVFLDNHDTTRFLTESGDNKDKLKLALSFAMTINRVPTIYYGTEVAMDAKPPASDPGGWSEASRKDMEWDKDPDMLKYFKQLTSARNDNIALRQGRYLEMWQDDKILAYSRLHPEQEGIVVLNNGYDTQHRDIPLRTESALKDGTVLKDLLTGDKVTVQGGKIHTEIQGKKARIFVPA